MIYTAKLDGRQVNRPLKNYSGARFGRLVAVQLLERRADNNHLWRFVCDCGAVKDSRIKNVTSGRTTSCGCAFREMLVARNTKHGLALAMRSTYRTWKDMRGRCNCPTDTDYADYGGRGIKVCERWGDFDLFVADMGERPDGMTLDRIDVDGDYEPGNCRWADSKQQANNKRSNHRISFDGREQTLAQWCAEFGLDSSKVRYRLKVGWPLERVFSPGDGRSHGAKADHRDG